MDETQDHWEVGFEFGHQGIALEEVPHWDPRNFKLGEERGFRYLLLKPPQSKKALSIMLWDKAYRNIHPPRSLRGSRSRFH
jgi:hypothetical protein